MSDTARNLIVAGAAGAGYYGDSLGIWRGELVKAGGAGADRSERILFAAIFGVAAYALLAKVA